MARTARTEEDLARGRRGTEEDSPRTEEFRTENTEEDHGVTRRRIKVSDTVTVQ